MDQSARFACAGTLVARREVITAAHCIDRDTTRIVVQRFRHGDRCSPATESVGVVAVKQDGEVAVLTLGDDMFGRAPPASLERDHADDELIAWGWGGINGAVCRVRPVVLARLGSESCGSLRITDAPILCAKGRSDNTCVGDSGGPVVSDGMPIAITIRGLGCLPPDAGLYAVLD